jgi:CTP:molybdopterin cytidylyltransferase MocA
MGSSIARGVEQLPIETRAILVALVDQPAIPPEVPKALIEEWRRTGALLIVPERAGRRGHPVLIDAILRGEMLRLAPERGLRALFDEHREEVLRLAVQSPYIARDIDTWDDYRSLYMEVFKVEPPPLKA